MEKIAYSEIKVRLSFPPEEGTCGSQFDYPNDPHHGSAICQRGHGHSGPHMWRHLKNEVTTWTEPEGYYW